MSKKYDDATRCDYVTDAMDAMDAIGVICATMIPIAKPVMRSAEIDSVADGCSRAGNGG